MPQFTTDPHTWDPPDDVDLIIAQERYEESRTFDSDVRAWMVNDDDAVDYATLGFIGSDAYDVAFAEWVKAGGR